MLFQFEFKAVVRGHNYAVAEGVYVELQKRGRPPEGLCDFIYLEGSRPSHPGDADLFPGSGYGLG